LTKASPKSLKRTRTTEITGKDKIKADNDKLTSDLKTVASDFASEAIPTTVVSLRRYDWNNSAFN